MPRASTLLAWADVRVGFPSALMRVVALMALSTAFCATVIVWRHLTSEGCNTLSMAKTSGKAHVLSIRSGKAHVLSIRIQSHIVFLYTRKMVPITWRASPLLVFLYLH